MKTRHISTAALALVTLAGLAVLSGCASAPGPALDANRMNDDLSAKTSTEVYPVKLITASVILAEDKQRAAQQEAAAAGMAPQGASATPLYDYHVQSPDVLSITVYGHPELASAAPLPSVSPSTETTPGALSPSALSADTGDGGAPTALGERVAADGTIFFPTLGRLRVAGKTTEQIATQLAYELGKTRRKPQVDVSVLRYRSQVVQLTGELKTPGPLPVNDAPMTLVSAIARAGGTLPGADLHRVRLTRDGTTRLLDVDAVYDHGDNRQNLLLRNGDIVNVPDGGNNRVFVLGEALKPAVLPMSKWRMTLADAVTNVGSIDPKSADPRQIYVIRGAQDNPTQPSIYRLDMTQIDSILLATQFQLHPLDVVYIGTASSARFNRVLDQILPSLQALFYTVQLGR